jgi:hypothetical protein
VLLPLWQAASSPAGAVYPACPKCYLQLQGGATKHSGGRLFKDTNKGDWAFVAACLAGAVLCGIWSVKLGAEHYKARHSATEFSSSHRPAK